MASDAVLGWRGARDAKRNLLKETTGDALQLLDEEGKSELLFDCIRAGNIDAVQNIIDTDPKLSGKKIWGYEGSNVKNEIKVKDGDKLISRCYHFTGVEKDGFFLPQHVAAESGFKEMLRLFMFTYFCDMEEPDYRGIKAEEKCNGDTIHAFYEQKGMKFESHERYEGGTITKREKVMKEGKPIMMTSTIRSGSGVLFLKPEGFESTEKVLYRGTFKDNKYVCW